MKKLRAVAVLAGLLSVTSVDVQAQTCGGSDFKTCASVTILPTVVNSTTTHISMWVTNNSGFNGSYAGTIFGAFGVFGLPQYSLVSGSFGFSGSGNWAFGTPGLNGSGIISAIAGGNATGPGGLPVNGLLAGQSVNLWFDLSGVPFTSFDPNDWAVHGQSGPNGCSTKLVVTNGVANGGAYNTSCGVDPVTGLVTPEPASLILLGTGLAGIAGVVRRRRRED